MLDYQERFNVVVCSFCVKKHEKLIYKVGRPTTTNTHPDASRTCDS